MNVFEKIRKGLKGWTYTIPDEIVGHVDVIDVDDVIDIINQVEKDYNNGWIPVNERLPKPKKRYLVTARWEDSEYKPNRVYDVYDAVYGADGLWHRVNYHPVPFEVIAWQPLPPAYKESEEQTSKRLELMRECAERVE